jgi:NADH dehydrogenase subunit M (EC 1.6.5.3)
MTMITNSSSVPRLLLPFTPDAAQYFAPVLAALAVVGVVAGAFGALSQVNGDIKRGIL